MNELKKCEALFEIVKQLTNKIPEVEDYHFETLRDTLADLITELGHIVNK